MEIATCFKSRISSATHRIQTSDISRLSARLHGRRSRRSSVHAQDKKILKAISLKTPWFSLLFLPVLAAPAFAGVNINSPSNGNEVSSPFTVSANASTCSSQNVVSMAYSLDNDKDIAVVYTGSVQAKVSSATGAHTLHVKAWGNRGSVCVTDVALSVTTPTNSPVIPSNAVAVSGLQALPHWTGTTDLAGQGNSAGSTSITNSPAQSGSARQFKTTYINNGDHRYFVQFGDDTEAHNFLYDAWVYLNSSSSQISNLEMDMNQVMPNGQTVIFGIQCDGWTGTWDYTVNAGTPTHPSDQWVHAKAPCNVRTWSINKWHHIQITYSRDDYGNVTYRSVWLDNVRQDINATVPSAFALGWEPVLLTNFQVDGLGRSGSHTVYLDNLTVYRW